MFHKHPSCQKVDTGGELQPPLQRMRRWPRITSQSQGKSKCRIKVDNPPAMLTQH